MSRAAITSSPPRAPVRPSAARSARTAASFSVSTSRSRISTRPLTMVVRRRRPASRRPGGRSGRTSAAAAARRVSTTMTSARLPASSDPTCRAEPSAARAADGRHLQRDAGAGSARGSLARHLLQERGLPHRLEHVEVVVAGRAVGAEPDRDAGRHTPRPAPCRSPASCCFRGCARRRRPRLQHRHVVGPSHTPCAPECAAPEAERRRRYAVGVRVVPSAQPSPSSSVSSR